MTPATAFVLCGGLGTRLRSAIGDSQKTLAEAGGVPFVERVMAWAAGGGVRRFVLCAGYRASEVLGRYAGREGVVVSTEPEPLGTAGALAFARGRAGPGPVLVLNGDSLCPLDLPAFLAYAAAKGGAASVAVVDPGDRVDGGFVAAAPDGRVVSFEERAPGPGRFLNAGVYVLSAAALAALPEGPSSLEKDALPRLVPEGVWAWRTDAPLWDIGTPERLAAFRAAVEE